MADLIDEEDQEGYTTEEQDETEINWQGHEKIITRARYAAGAGVTEKSRSYTEISSGSITFGYRDADSLTRHPVYKVEPASETISGTTYKGIKTTASRIKIGQRLNSDGVRVFVGGTTPGFTGYMQVMTNVQITSLGVVYTLEKLYFAGGICLTRR